MIRSRLFHATLLAALCPAGVSAVVVQDPVLEFSCAAFPADLRVGDLVERFGAENVTTLPVIGSDDGPEDGTVLFAETADARLDIMWSNESRERPRWIKVSTDESRWRTPSGISIGDDLLSLEAANRKPFRLSGFWREGGVGGSVISWSGGALETTGAADCAVRIQLQPAYDGTADPRFTRQVRSGPEYSSGHPAMQALNPRVVAMWISYR